MAEYTFDVQKLYLEMMLADAESFARANNIFDSKNFDRKLQPIAKFVQDYVDEYKVMPEVEQVNAKFDIKLKSASLIIGILLSLIVVYVFKVLGLSWTWYVCLSVSVNVISTLAVNKVSETLSLL